MNARRFLVALCASAVSLTAAHARAADECSPADAQGFQSDQEPAEEGFAGAGPGGGAGGGVGAGPGAGAGDIPGYHATGRPGDFGPGYRWAHSGFEKPGETRGQQDSYTCDEGPEGLLGCSF